MTPVELQVTNLDQNIDQRDMKKTILNIFREHVTVMSVSVFFQSGKFINHILLDKIFRRIIQYFITFFQMAIWLLVFECLRTKMPNTPFLNYIGRKSDSSEF